MIFVWIMTTTTNDRTDYFIPCTCTQVPGPPAFQCATLKSWDGPGYKAILPLCTHGLIPTLTLSKIPQEMETILLEDFCAVLEP